MTNQAISYAIFASISFAIIGAMLIDESLADLFFSISGFGYMVFGTWGAIRLYKSE